MKIVLDIPDEFILRRFMLLAGTELVASKEPYEDFWKVKIASCNLCGECCMDEPASEYGIDDEGKCNALQRWGNTWECSVQHHKPFNCLPDPKEGEYPCCSIRYKIEKGR